MIIAKQKKKENIAEYVLYIWQIEDMIRAVNLDVSQLEDSIITKYDTDETTRNEIREWYKGLVVQMKEEGKTKSGHLQFIENQINDLYDFHLYLMQDQSETTYHQVYNLARPDIAQFSEKSKNKSPNEVYLVFNALYSLLLLRLQGKKVSDETEKAMTGFSNFLGLLSAKYLKFHKGESELNIK